MFLGTVLVNQTIQGVPVKKKALVVAFEQIVKNVIDRKAGFLRPTEESHYEVLPNQTRLVLATYRGESALSYSAQESVDVPLSFEQVDALLAASAKSGEAVDLQRLHAPTNDASPKAEPQIGDKMPAGHPNAGWIYAGISKTTHEPFYVAPKDSGVFQWKEAMAFAAKEGSRVPSREELNQLYDARDQGALKGTFNVTGSLPAGWYWSSSQNGLDAWAQRFSDGDQDVYNKSNDSSLRCVR
jgi:hypothetical protein